MGAISKEPPKTAAQSRKWKAGALYRCTLSASPGYKFGQVYKCHTVKDLGLCLTGSDGFTDPVGMLDSGFMEVKDGGHIRAA
jgi:hypothetical protein